MSCTSGEGKELAPLDGNENDLGLSAKYQGTSQYLILVVPQLKANSMGEAAFRIGRVGAKHEWL